MADSASVNKIFNEYSELRSIAAAKRQEAIDFVYNSLPRVKEIDEEMNRLGMENVKNIIKAPQKSEELNKEYKEKLDKLEEEKTKLLEENNISPDYKEYKYKCSICSDTGHTPDGKRCNCLIKKLIEINYNASNLGEKLKEENFDNF